MKPNLNKYREVTELPKKAMQVKEYAEREMITHQYVYKKVKEGKNKGEFEMIIYMGESDGKAIKGRNYVIPY